MHFCGMDNQKPQELVYSDLSYSIIGICHTVFNEVGPGHHEKVYQRAVATVLGRKGISYKKELPIKIYFEDVVVGKSFLDFQIEDKIILELKKDTKFSKSHIDQVNRYLRETNLKLGLLVNFTREGVKVKRIVNLY